jgi:hypothetical protein
VAQGTIFTYLGRDEYVDDLPVPVDGPVHVPPYTADLHVGLVDEPPVARRTTSEQGYVRQEWYAG